MRKLLLILNVILILTTSTAFSQSDWPRDIVLENGTIITIYQPQPERLYGNKLEGRAVVSVKLNKDAEPVFGVVWSNTNLLTDKDSRKVTMENIKITEVKFPDVTDQAKIDSLKRIIEREAPKWNLESTIDEVIATLEQEQPVNADQLKTDAPEVIYTNQPTTLILIDGEPKVKKDDQLNIERVFNTAFLIIRNPDDSKYYLYAGTVWYVSSSVTEGWTVAKTLPKSVKAIDAELKKKEKETQQNTSSTTPTAPTAIIVRTKSAEIIQTKGEAQFSSVEGTGLLYVSNTDDEIFRCVENQQYYILLSGRWYKATALKGPWSYVASDKLPADFAKIPEGTDKDVVLPFVGGTDASREAVMDAQIPQTAKIDRNSTECTVRYDGEPKFELIEGTSMQVALNTSSTVLLANNKYYAVENGVWFVSDKPAGPWKVSAERPAEVDKIPAENQAYNTKYVYIYETTPEYVYVGYTPGYMGCYVYGPTVVYGTGYYYNPWYGPWYYPRPVTWGFGMHYNPWTGWGMSGGFSYGFMTFSVGFGGYGGYWGCHGYHPPYHHGDYHGGHYGNNYVHNEFNIDRNRTNNVYNNRRDASTKDVNRGPSASTRDNKSNRATTGNRASAQPANRASAADRSSAAIRPSAGASNNMYSDKSGNVYRKESNGDWQQRNNGSWQSSSNRQSSASQMDRSSQQRDRGNMRSSNASAYSRPSGGGYSGGGARGGGARGGGRR